MSTINPVIRYDRRCGEIIEYRLDTSAGAVGAYRKHDHTHASAGESRPVAYSATPRGPWDGDERAASGNIDVTQTCACGATRRQLRNGRHVASSQWVYTAES